MGTGTLSCLSPAACDYPTALPAAASLSGQRDRGCFSFFGTKLAGRRGHCAVLAVAAESDGHTGPSCPDRAPSSPRDLNSPGESQSGGWCGAEGLSSPVPLQGAWWLVLLARIRDLPDANETAEGEAADGGTRPGGGGSRRHRKEGEPGTQLPPLPPVCPAAAARPFWHFSGCQSPHREPGSQVGPGTGREEVAKDRGRCGGTSGLRSCPGLCSSPSSSQQACL